MGHIGLPLPQTALKGPAVACVKGYQGFPNIHSILIGICQAAFKYQHEKETWKLQRAGCQEQGLPLFSCATVDGKGLAAFPSSGSRRSMTGLQQTPIGEQYQSRGEKREKERLERKLCLNLSSNLKAYNNRHFNASLREQLEFALV